jgi:hypothetical protein
MHMAQRAESLAPFYVVEPLEAEREMEAHVEDIVHMEIGMLFGAQILQIPASKDSSWDMNGSKNG